MQRFLLGLGLVVLSAVTIACSGTSAAPPSGSPSTPPASPGAPTDGAPLVVVAKDLVFEQQELVIPAGTPVEIVLDNQDEAPHNIAIKDGAGETVFKGKIVGKERVTNAVPALAAGSYTFWCEVHPDMVGTITAK